MKPLEVGCVVEVVDVHRTENRTWLYVDPRMEVSPAAPVSIEAGQVSIDEQIAAIEGLRSAWAPEINRTLDAIAASLRRLSTPSLTIEECETCGGGGSVKSTRVRGAFIDCEACRGSGTHSKNQNTRGGTGEGSDL